MTEAVIFETPGLLDLKAATTFGINVKKGLNPIGYFGTGLKYAIAVLVREGIPVTFYIGGAEYVFYSKGGKFRDKEFDFVMMKKRNSIMRPWNARQMPFTTEFGKNWELWQAFRELESNTRDEGGFTEFREHDVSGIMHLPDKTRIVVEGSAFRKVWEQRADIFLPDALTVWEGNDSIQVFKRPSNAVYYRGLKVMELKTMSKMTYNILSPVSLTEDRTVKYDWELRDAIMRYICCTTKDMQVINEVVTADEKTTWEGSFPFDQLWQNPSEQFMQVIGKKKARSSYHSVPRSTYIAPRVEKLWESHQPKEPKVKQPVNALVERLDEILLDDVYYPIRDLLRETIDVLKTHEDYDEVKLPEPVTDYGDDIPF